MCGCTRAPRAGSRSRRGCGHARRSPAESDAPLIHNYRRRGPKGAGRARRGGGRPGGGHSPRPAWGPSGPANTHNFARTSHLCTDTSGKGRSRSGDTVRGADSWGVNSARLPDPQVSSLGPSLGPQFFQPSPSQAVRLRLLRPRRARRQGGKAPPRE